MGLTPERIEFGVAANLVFCRLVPKRGAGRLWVERVQLGRRRPIPVFSVDSTMQLMAGQVMPRVNAAIGKPAVSAAE
jgi:hypothetical protein